MILLLQDIVPQVLVPFERVTELKSGKRSNAKRWTLRRIEIVERRGDLVETEVEGS
ncbi:hypothetical protein LCGC14_2434630 [marine sediment metagenome]|uniref:Uncharacterized protein n=1 Tax=marine sediment metagenome TaxID=412755 RepID=A0A0F9C879_9ZZZZ